MKQTKREDQLHIIIKQMGKTLCVKNAVVKAVL